ncbi:acylneuraminate cytidylyltransferase family protein [Candidatus Atribacteria bacterium HGW-Atribacteria-1]|nr:MAG: acylneuraminate cytidylyltransferase family protein [Candidatus Atribacteria bacterium HGW-Atribacteria-1]
MIAIIPARGGSKGLPGKNIKVMNGKPLIWYTINVAKKSKFIDKIIVSTDDDKIAKISKSYGVEIPFIRPKELARDDSLAIDNYIYTIDRLNKEFNYSIGEFVVLQPTSPLRTLLDIDNAIQIFREKKADSVISVSEVIHPPLWSKRINGKGLLRNYFDISMGNKNRQEIEKAYMPNGAIFIFKYSLIKEKHSYYSNKTYPYIMPLERSIDIDSKLDFEFAEYLIKKNARNKFL